MGKGEDSLSFYKEGGHDHDGENSTKINFENYSLADLKWIKDEILQLVSNAYDEVNSLSDDSFSGGGQAATDWVVVFTHPGTITTPMSPPYYPYPDGGTTESVHVSVGVPGTTDSTIAIYKNGVQQGADITLAANAYTASANIAATFGTSDFLMVKFKTVGTDACEGVIQVLFAGA